MNQIPSHDTDRDLVKSVLVQAQELFPEFGIFVPTTLYRYRASTGNTLLRYFSEQSEEARQALSAYVIDHAKDRPFGEVMRFLRIVNGKTASQVSIAAFGREDLAPKVSNIEAGDGNPYTQVQIFKLLESQIFALSSLNQKQLRTLWANDRQCATPMTRDELFQKAAKQIEEYRKGERPLEKLMTCNEALETLFEVEQRQNSGKKQYQSLEGLSPYLFPERHSGYLSAWLNGDNDINDEIFGKIAQEFGLAANSQSFALLARLPVRTQTSKPKHFLESVRAEMVKPEVERVFRHPGFYDSSGSWLQALRVAAELALEHMAQELGVCRQNVHQVESNSQKLSARLIDGLLQSNCCSLPACQNGRISNDDRALFTQLARTSKQDWMGKIKSLGLEETHANWKEAGNYFYNQLKGKRTYLRRYFDEYIARELDAIDTGCEKNEAASFSIMIENRPVRVLRQNGEDLFALEDIRALARDRHFVQRLEALARNQSEGIAMQ